MRQLLLALLVTGSLVAAGCGDMENIESATYAVEPVQDGGMNGFHCGPTHDFFSKAYVCHVHCTPRGVCTKRTKCVPIQKLQEHLDHGDALNECPL